MEQGFKRDGRCGANYRPCSPASLPPACRWKPPHAAPRHRPQTAVPTNQPTPNWHACRAPIGSTPVWRSASPPTLSVLRATWQPSPRRGTPCSSSGRWAGVPAQRLSCPCRRQFAKLSPAHEDQISIPGTEAPVSACTPHAPHPRPCPTPASSQMASWTQPPFTPAARS